MLALALTIGRDRVVALAEFFYILGAIALLSELFVPGGIVMCLGLSALATGAMCSFGWVSSVPFAFMVCCAMSAFLVMPVQFILQKFSQGEVSVASVDEDVENFGKIVDVIEDISEEHDMGRIVFQGCEWPASSHEGRIAKGLKAKIIGRENLVWIVESV